MTTARRRLALLALLAVGAAIGARMVGPTAEHVPAVQPRAPAQSGRSDAVESFLATLPLDQAAIREPGKGQRPERVLQLVALGLAVLVLTRRPRWFPTDDVRTDAVVRRLGASIQLRGPPALLFG
ncbi:MAG TPA: hypothetical protein VFA83_16120 [Acidimicrobiales bacterium]|nr:hypothetical protein [Acidimicrobiales bacterium]